MGDKMTEKELIKEIKKLGKIKEKHLVKGNYNGKYRYIRRYDDCTAIVEKIADGTLYIAELGNIYGPFADFRGCLDFRKLLKRYSYAHQVAMWASWAEEGENFCKSGF